MKLRNIVIINILLLATVACHASDLASRMNEQAQSLNNAQAALAGLIGYQSQGANTPSATMITNKALQKAYLIMFDEQLTQLNQTMIALAPGEFSYIPGNAKSIKVVNGQNMQLATTSITINNQYSITNQANQWAVDVQTAPGTPAPFSYKNTAGIPVIIQISTGDLVNQQQILPGATYTQMVDPTSQTSLELCANLSSFFAAYDPVATYEISMNGQSDIVLKKTSDTGNTLNNLSGWPMFLSFSSADDDQNFTVLEDTQSYNPAAFAKNIAISHVIANKNTPPATIKSCTIINNRGKLDLQFS